MAYVSFALDLTSSRRCEFGLCNTTDCPRCTSISATQSHELTVRLHTSSSSSYSLTHRESALTRHPSSGSFQLSALGFAPGPVPDILTAGFQARERSFNKLARTIRHGAEQSSSDKTGCVPHTLDGSDSSGEVLQMTRPPSYRTSSESHFTSSLNNYSKEDCSVAWDLTDTDDGALNAVCAVEHDLTSKDNRKECCTWTLTPTDRVSGRVSASCGSMVFDHLKLLLGELNIAAHSPSTHHIGWAFEGPSTKPQPSSEFDKIPYELTMPSLCDMKDRINHLEAARGLPLPRQEPIILRTFSSIPAWGLMPQVRASVTLQTTSALACPPVWTQKRDISSSSALTC